MKKNGKEKKYISIPQLGYLFFCVVTMQAYWIRPVYAVTVWEKASEIMKDVYDCSDCDGGNSTSFNEFFSERQNG